MILQKAIFVNKYITIYNFFNIILRRSRLMKIISGEGNKKRIICIAIIIIAILARFFCDAKNEYIKKNIKLYNSA